MNCPFCECPISPEKKNSIADTLDRFIAMEKIELLADLQDRICGANAGEPSPTEWKVLGIIDTLIKEIEELHAV